MILPIQCVRCHSFNVRECPTPQGPVLYNCNGCAVYFCADRPRVRESGSPAFFAALDEMADMHERKSMDYGSKKDVMANLRASEAYGVPAWVGVSVRINDKEQRIRSFLEKGVLANESLEDSLIDHAVYSVLRLVLYRELVAQQATARVNAAPTMDNNDIPAASYTPPPRQDAPGKFICGICSNPNCDNPNGKH